MVAINPDGSVDGSFLDQFDYGAREGSPNRIEPDWQRPKPALAPGMSAIKQSGAVPRWQWCVECNGRKARKWFSSPDDTRCTDCLAALTEARHKVRQAQANRTARELAILNRCQNYNITIEEFERMSLAQNHRCAICDERARHDRPLHIDHDHKSGRVRGLLCVRCNTALGKLRDKVENLERAIGYLESPPAAELGIYGYGRVTEGPESATRRSAKGARGGMALDGGSWLYDS